MSTDPFRQNSNQVSPIFNPKGIHELTLAQTFDHQLEPQLVTEGNLKDNDTISILARSLDAKKN
jgi:hypothetical protein